MKLRTVLNELPIRTFEVHGRKQLDSDVVVSPASYEGDGLEGIIRLGTMEDLARLGAPEDGHGVLLVYQQADGASAQKPAAKTVVYAFGDVTPEEFQAAFNRLVARSGVLAVRRERLFNAYLSSYDIRQFAEAASRALRNPLVISNVDHKILASAGDFPDGAEDVRATIRSGYVAGPVADQMEADGFIRKAREARRAIISEGGTTGVRNVSSIIYHHHLEVGRLDVFEVRHITGLDLELVDYASSLAGIMIDRLGIAGERAGMGSSVFADLLDGKMASPDALRALVSIDKGEAPLRYVLVSVVGEKGADGDYYRKAAQVMYRVLRGNIWAIHGSSVVVLVAQEVGDTVGFAGYEGIESYVLKNREFSAFLETNGMTAYVCDPFDDLADCAAALRQCLELEAALRDQPDGKTCVHFFWQERYAVLASYARRDGRLDGLLDKRVIAMANYDRKHKTSYLRTAVMSVRYPGEPVVAAEALNVHRNTYFYRVNKIRELFYLDLKDGEDRLAVAFTTHLVGA